MAESCKPFILIVVVPAVAVMAGVVTIEPAEQEIADKPFGVLITNPAGRVSEKLISPRAVEFGLVNVKVNVLAFPRAIVVGEKLLVSVGAEGLWQPVTFTLSTYIVAVAFCAPAAKTLKYTVDADVVVLTVIPPTCHEFALFQTAELPVGEVQFVPSVLKMTYQLCALDQLPCKL